MTKIMSWNIENFDNTKIAVSATTIGYQNWDTGLGTYLAGYPGATILDFVQEATTNFPPQNGNAQYGRYVTLILDQAITLAVAAIAAGNTSVQFANAFIAYVPTAALPPTPAWPAARFTAGLLPFATVAGTSILSTLCKIFEIFFRTTCGAPTIANNILYQQVALQMNTAANAAVLHANVTTAVGNMAIASVERNVLSHIMDNISPVAVMQPDIIVIMEVLSATAVGQFTTIDGVGAIGIMNLLNNLRTLNPNYCLIPPVRMGNSLNDWESIAVFYDASKLEFHGPCIWNGTNAVAYSTTVPPSSYIDPATGGNTVWQPATYATPPSPPLIGVGCALPNRQVTVNIAGTPTVLNEYQLAGQCTFVNPTTGPLSFTTANDRPPLITDFIEIAGGRQIRICSMHPNRGPVSASTAPAAVAQIANIPEMTTALGTSRVGVIVGDFNTQLLNAGAKASSYGVLTGGGGGGLGYSLVFDDALAPANPAYLCTTLEDLANTSLLTNPFATLLFPSNGYLKIFPPASPTSGTAGSIYESLDNILVSGGTVYSNAVVLNRVVGVDLVNAAASTIVTPPCTYGYGAASIAPAASPYGYAMSQDINAITRGGTPIAVFRDITNYGKIRATSDHMALVITI